MEWSGNEKERLLQDGNPKELKEISTAIIADKAGIVNIICCKYLKEAGDRWNYMYRLRLMMMR